MNKENCTKGPVTAEADGAIVDRGGFEVAYAEKSQHHKSSDEWVANAELIAEAFNVLHETGMTPRELATTMHEYRELLAALRLTIYADMDQCSGNVQHFYANRLKERKDLDRDSITGKHQPVTPA